MLFFFSSALATPFGDLNCDGDVSVTDVQLSIIVALGLPVSPVLDENQDGTPDACVATYLCGEGTVVNEAGTACVVSPTALEEAEQVGFDAGVASIQGDSDVGAMQFSQAIQQNGAVWVTTLPAGTSNAFVRLSSPANVDLRVVDAETGVPWVAWPNGFLNTPFEQCTSIGDVTLTYSGYDGIGSDQGEEYVIVEGTLETDIEIKVFGYEEGTAEVAVFWGISLPAGCAD